jgi:membrane-associated phospholipid phosphatase
MTQLLNGVARSSSPSKKADSPAPPDAVRYWNGVLLEAALADSRKPYARREQGGVTRTSRAMAVVQAAVHDAVNGVDRRYQTFVFQGMAPAGASPEAAVAAAAHSALVRLYPSQAAALDADMAAYLALVGDGREVGVRFGTVVGTMAFNARRQDGAAFEPPVLQKDTPGEWRGDPLDGPQEAETPGWGAVRPFALASGAQFRPAPYPCPGTPAYAEAVAEAAAAGAEVASPPGSPTREAARFWSYDDGLGTPARLYNQCLWGVLDSRPLPPAPTARHAEARLLALANLALADATVAAWDAKYAYSLWRPVDGVRRAAAFGPVPGGAAGWRPLGRPRHPDARPNTTPASPSYVSGHAALGSALFRVLERAYGEDETGFELISEEVSLARRFGSFTAAAAENGMSRVWLGVAWPFDVVEGKALGRRVADHVFGELLRPLRA